MKKRPRALIPDYSYKHFKSEEKSIYKRLAVITGLIFVLVLALIFWGTSLVSLFGLIGEKEAEPQPAPLMDRPLTEPRLENLSEFTNKGKITISGTTTAGASVSLFVNTTQIGKIQADINGYFTFIDVPLKEGLNLIRVTASKSGKTLETKTTITFDKTPPLLEIYSPKDGQSFDNTKNITLTGKSEPDSEVFINSYQATVDPNGNFTKIISVNPGENKIEVSSIDRAGNKQTINIIVTVSE